MTELNEIIASVFGPSGVAPITRTVAATTASPASAGDSFTTRFEDRKPEPDPLEDLSWWRKRLPVSPASHTSSAALAFSPIHEVDEREKLL
jgi:hypothetical protein